MADIGIWCIPEKLLEVLNIRCFVSRPFEKKNRTQTNVGKMERMFSKADIRK